MSRPRGLVSSLANSGPYSGPNIPSVPTWYQTWSPQKVKPAVQNKKQAPKFGQLLQGGLNLQNLWSVWNHHTAKWYGIPLGWAKTWKLHQLHIIYLAGVALLPVITYVSLPGRWERPAPSRDRQSAAWHVGPWERNWMWFVTSLQAGNYDDSDLSTRIVWIPVWRKIAMKWLVRRIVEGLGKPQVK